jgi:hypothetical protein
MNTFTKVSVRGCDECPLHVKRETSSLCTVSARELSGDLAQAPAWCPARGGVTVHLDEQPGDYHRWTERGIPALKPQLCKGEISACRRCTLRRKSVQRWFTEAGGVPRSAWTWAYEVNGEWVFHRPGCGPAKVAP